MVQGRSQRNHEEEPPSKYRWEEAPNGRSRGERSHCEKSLHEGSCRENRDEEKSHRLRHHRDKSYHEESQHSRQDVKMKKLEEKYTQILRLMGGEDPKMIA